MHMADALLSPSVGGALWAATAGTVAVCSRSVRRNGDESAVPLMGVLGAFVFAAQMINFTIPGTGSSGHLGGGLLLAALVGPAAAFLVLASVLSVQALFFADGGLLALGANIFNLGVFPCFVAYPLIYRPLAGDHSSHARILAASLLAAVAGLSLGAAGVVAETVFSGISELPPATFAALMLPIHVAIGLVEGLATASVVSFVKKARPETLAAQGRGVPLSRLVAAFALLAALLGGVGAWFASERPDGLEWSIERTAGGAEVEGRAGGAHGWLASIQNKLSFLPDYALPTEEGQTPAKAETSLAGLVGGFLTLLLALAGGWLLSRRGPSTKSV